MLFDIVAIVLYTILSINALSIVLSYLFAAMYYDDEFLPSISMLIERFQPLTKFASGIFTSTIFLILFLAAAPHYDAYPDLELYAFVVLCGMVGIVIFDTDEFHTLHMLSLLAFWSALLIYINRFMQADPGLTPYVIFVDVTSGLGFMATAFNMWFTMRSTQTLFELIWATSLTTLFFVRSSHVAGIKGVI